MTIRELRALSGEALDAIFGHNDALVQRIRRDRGGDLFFAMARVAREVPAARARMIELFGPSFEVKLRNLNRQADISPAHIEAYLGLFSRRRPKGIGNYLDVKREIVDANLGHTGDLEALVEADHVVDERFIAMIREGAEEFERRTVGNPRTRTLVDEDHPLNTLAMAVPRDQVVFYRMMRRMRNRSWRPSYFHRGPNSKTARMNELIPANREGHFTLQQIYDAHRWVLLHEYGLPASVFEPLIRDEIVDAIRHAFENDAITRQIIEEELRRRGRSSRSDRLEASLSSLLQNRELTASDFAPTNWPSLPPVLRPLLGAPP